MIKILSFIIFYLLYSENIPEIFIERLNQVPDIMQMDKDNQFPENGRFYCAPVAAANYITWLGKNGYPDLIDSNSSDKKNVLNIALELGKKDFMNATQYGVSVKKFKKAIIKYIERNGYNIDYSSYWGFDLYDSENPPSLDYIKKSLSNNGVVWLLVGKYSYDHETDIYTSTAFHYISIIGYGVDKDGNLDKNSLIVNCSSPRSGTNPESEYLEIIKITSSKLEIPFLKKQFSAKDFLEIRSGLKWKRENEVIVINGIVSIIIANI